MPRDGHGRIIDYLRISVMDRCNLRCTYCMPLEGLRFLPEENLLTADEIALVARAAVSCGFRKFRITGGEPTLRRDLVEVVAGIRAAGPDVEIGMTTNGMLLPRMAKELKDAGLDRVNVHIDTLDEVRIRQVMRFADLQKIMAGIDAAEAAGLTPIKLNSVVVRGENDTDVVELARQTLTRPWGVRFIELMPMGDGEEAKLALSKVVPSQESMEKIIDSLGPLNPIPAVHASDESRNYQLSGAIGTVGFISPVSDPFCSACNRVRLSAEGKLLLCLLRDDEADLRAVIRSGGGVDAVSRALREAILLKPVGHALDEGIHASRRMHEIGG
ncbi:MAG: GTP 3',8-cyclase MoaA [Planctomycetota bacterium]|nr:GTP 3',8-cyclase MoaA [Planctomycetota bacterium]